MRSASRRLGLKVGATALMVAAFLTGSNAQNQPGGVAPVDGPQVYRTTGSRVAIGRSITIPRDEEVSDAVVVIGGSLRVEGRVRDGIVVVGGDVELGPQADVRGDVVLVGGTLTRADSAQLRGSVSNVNYRRLGQLDVRRLLVSERPIRRLRPLAVAARHRLPHCAAGRRDGVHAARGARAGRAHRPQCGCRTDHAHFSSASPRSIFFVPVLVAACIALVVTIIGIPLVAIVVPGAFCLAFIALMLGFTGLACHIGEWVEDRFGWRAHSALLATSIGLFLIVGPTMLARLLNLTPGPLQGLGFGLLIAGALFELVIWTIGLGAALMTGFGRWSTAPPPVPPPNAHGVIPVAS